MRKGLNIFSLSIQWFISLLAAVYLLVPSYHFTKNDFSGISYYNPYVNWQDKPLQAIKIDSNQSVQNNLIFSPLDFAAPVYILDTVSHIKTGRFFFGYSPNDIQYLVKKERKDSESRILVIKQLESKMFGAKPIKGVNLLFLSGIENEIYWDTLLSYGQPVFGLAVESANFHALNFVTSSKENTNDIIKSLGKGENLMAFSPIDILDTSLRKIPVMRSIEWKNQTIHLDLSEAGEISLIASGFQLDTLSQSLNIKLINQDWVRFKIRFHNPEIIYVSNPIFRNTGGEIKLHEASVNNVSTLFLNFLWLVGLILINRLMNKMRKRI